MLFLPPAMFIVIYWHTSLYKFQVYTMMVWLACIMQYILN